jgi:uncharacterized protein (DUF1330 family)
VSAYVIVDLAVSNASLYAQYESLVSATVEAYGGRYLAVGGRTERLEGDWLPGRLVILEFENLERIRQWFDSPEYKPVKELRHKAARTNMVGVEAIPKTLA